ncbi:hypothetical protein DSUL_150049 [Desulfovibrionales bacterium]
MESNSAALTISKIYAQRQYLTRYFVSNATSWETVYPAKKPFSLTEERTWSERDFVGPAGHSSG